MQILQRKTDLENIFWWRPDAIYGKFKQAGHVTKVCKLTNNLQVQNVKADIEEEQLFKISISKAKEVY